MGEPRKTLAYSGRQKGPPQLEQNHCVLVVRLRTLEMATMVFSSKNEEATKVAPISGQRSMGDIHWEGPKSCLITANPDLIHLSTEKQFTEAEILLSLIRIFSKSLRAAFSIH